MTLGIFAVSLAFIMLLAVIGYILVDNAHLALQAREAQIKAARVLAVYEATIAKNLKGPRR